MSDNELIATLGTLFLLALPFLIAIVLNHQRKMTMIIHGRQAQAQADVSLAQQMNEMRSLVAQQAILIDSIAQSQQSLARQLAQSEESRATVAAGS